MKRKLALILTTAIALSLVFVASITSSAKEVTISGDKSFPLPDKKTIQDKWKQLSYVPVEYEAYPSVSNPYSAGKLSLDYIQSGVDYLNFIRYVAHLPSVEANDALNESAQYGSVLLAASEFSHYPSRPVDMDGDFYKKGLDATSSSNISWGYQSIATSVQGCIEDNGSNNLATVGHRRWLLNPTLRYVGFGQTSSYITTKVFDKSGSFIDYDFISWPSSGNFPININQDSPWSITLNPQKYQTPDADKITIKLTHQSTGKSWRFDSTTMEGKTIASSVEYYVVDTNGYGVRNCIIFNPIIKDLGVYTVELSGIYTQTGSPTSLCYEVDLFDITQCIGEHIYEKICIQEATLWEEGEQREECTECGKIKPNSTTTISCPTNFTLSTTTYTYNGKAKTPNVVVKDSTGKSLKKGTDYTVSYESGRKNVGTYVVTIEMKGNYVGSKTLYFTINPAKPSSYKLSTTSYSYDGNVKTPSVIVKNSSGNTLKKDTDYTVTYARGRKNLGKYKVTVKLKGNYTGTKTLTFKINMATPVVKAVNATAGVKVTWNMVVGAKNYIVYRSVYSNGKWSGWTRIKTGATGTTYMDTTVKPNATVKYTVRAVNGSHMSLFKSSNTLKYLVTPTATAANATAGVKVTWNKVAGAKNYNIYRSVYSNGKWSGWARIKTSATGTTYMDTTVKPNTTVKYTVRAVNGSYVSSYKGGNAVRYLVAPTVKAENATAGVKVTWNKIVGAKNYIVYRSVYSNGKWNGWTRIKTGVTGTIYMDTTVKPNTTVKYTVRAVNGSYMSSYKGGNAVWFRRQER